MTTQDSGARSVTAGFSVPVLRPTRDSVRGLAGTVTGSHGSRTIVPRFHVTF
jgi:hypothetical protein